jgi:hypothetical protein
MDAAEVEVCYEQCNGVFKVFCLFRVAECATGEPAGEKPHRQVCALTVAGCGKAHIQPEVFSKQRNLTHHDQRNPVLHDPTLGFWRATCYVFGVSKFFRPNLGRHGRLARGVIGALCLVAGIIIAGDYSLWGLVFVAAGLFAIFESVRGWCLVRACGIKTKF